MPSILFDQDNDLTFVSDETFPNLGQINPQARLIYTVLKSMCLKDGVEYYSERIDIDGQNCMLQTQKGREGYQLHGMGYQAEDPRLFLWHNQIYTILNIIDPSNPNSRRMCITPYDDFQPVILVVKDFQINSIEKNWTPLVKDDQLYLIYMYDPLVVLRYDFNPDGLCELIFRQEGVTFPVTAYRHLRGGSNMIPLDGGGIVDAADGSGIVDAVDGSGIVDAVDGLYFGLCHSRIEADHTNIGGYPYPYYLPHLIVIDTNVWKIVYLSKPLRLEAEGTGLKTIEGTKILFNEGPWVTTMTPNSINHGSEDGYLATINFNEARCLKFKLRPHAHVHANALAAPKYAHEIGYWNDLGKNSAIALVQSATQRPSTYH